MQLLTTATINDRYNAGVRYLTNITYNKFIKDKYAVQYKSTNLDNRLLLLLFAMDTWDNREGATNWLTAQQMTAVLDQIAYAHRDPFTSAYGTASSGGCCGSSTALFRVEDTTSIHLSYVNGTLRASVIISPTANNTVSVHSNGVYGTNSGGGGTGSGGGGKIFLTGADFNTGTNVYTNALLAGNTTVSVWHRGLGYLLYDFDDPSNATNEYTIDPDGGIAITIPGFDVHTGNNYFYIYY